MNIICFTHRKKKQLNGIRWRQNKESGETIVVQKKKYFQRTRTHNTVLCIQWN